MDQFRFDALTKTFARGTSRRSVIKGAAGGAVAGLVALVGVKGGGAATATGTVRCNTHEKCEAACGAERATCCNGECVRPCPPRYFRSAMNCKCIKIFLDGTKDIRPPTYCGA